MRIWLAALLSCAAFPLVVSAQMGHTIDWWTFAGDAQRSGWAKNDQRFTKDEVKAFRKIWEKKLDYRKTGPRAVSAPVVFGNLIGSRGFKELAFVESASGDLWSIDVDLARNYWELHPDSSSLKGVPGACSAFAAVPSLPAPVVFRFGRPPGAAPGGSTAPPATSPTQAAGAPSSQPASAVQTTSTPQTTSPPRASGANPSPPPAPTAGTTGPASTTPPVTPNTTPPPEPPSPPSSALNAAFRVRPVYLVAPDGQLRQINIDDGSELHPSREFLPEGTKAQSLNIADNTIYAAAGSCKGGKDAGIYALDLNAPQAKPNVFSTEAAAAPPIANPAIGTNGVVYVQTGKGTCDPGAGKYGNTLLALTPKELKVKDYFLLDSNTAPLVFTYKGRELVATAGTDQRIYLLDANSLGGEDHKTPLFHTEPLGTIWGGLSTWEQPDGTRYVLAAIWGKYASNPNGSIVSFKLQDENGKLTLTPAWTSPDLLSPDPPVIAQGVVFALANGKYKGKRPDSSSHATLYAMDGTTGQVIWNTGDQVKAPGNLSGLTIANARLYFSTIDNVLHVFGKYLETE